jgi:ice-binding like protein/Big-like domain-containing protein
MTTKSRSNLSKAATAFLLLSCAAACDNEQRSADAGSSSDAGNSSDGGKSSDAGKPSDAGKLPDGGNLTTPTVLSNTPINGTVSVALNASLSATFSEAMDSTTVNASTFTLTSGTPAVSVLGTVSYANSTATFWPAAHLASNMAYAATVTSAAKSAYGVALAANHVWTFTTGNTVAAGVPVNLATAGNFVILSMSGISVVPTAAVTGDLGVSPAAATYITGFSLTADSTNVFATSPQVTGKVYASDYAVPTPSNMTTAIGDMQLAFTDAAGRAPDVTELGAGNIGGMTLPGGVYKWGTGLLIPTDVTLNGSATAVWIFQIAQDLTLSSAANIHLAGGALAKNIFWQVSGAVDLGTTAHIEGIVLSQTAINLRTGASINGRMLAQTAVSIDSSTVVEPAP